MPDTYDEIFDSVAAINDTYPHSIAMDPDMKRVLRAANAFAYHLKLDAATKDGDARAAELKGQTSPRNYPDDEVAGRTRNFFAAFGGENEIRKPTFRCLSVSPQQREVIGETLVFLQRLVTEFEANDPVSVEAAFVLGRFAAHCCDFVNSDSDEAAS